MEITYLGHSSFRIKSKKVSLVTDPFDEVYVGIKFPKVSADIVTVSHDHKDHNNVSAVGSTRMVIDGPGEYEVSGVTILGFSTYHDEKKGELRGKNTVYVIEAADIRILHLGDLGHVLSDKTLEKIGDVNVLMVPTGGIYTLDSKKAYEMVKKMSPQITIPMHYKLPGMKEDVFGKLEPVDEFLKEIDFNVEKTSKLKFKASDLDDGEKVVVLENK